MFASREAAGVILSHRLEQQGIGGDVVVGIPRGGVVVAAVVARLLQLSLRVILVKKIGAPLNSERAVGAVTDIGAVYLDPNAESEVSTAYLDQEKKRLISLLRERFQQWGLKKLSVASKNAVLVDDGMATGATVMAAVQELKQLKVDKITLAIPVASLSAVALVKPHVDNCLIIEMPMYFQAVGQYYKDFREVGDEEVKTILREQNGKMTNS